MAKSNKEIKLTFDGVEYTLAYNRAAVMKMEADGYNLQDLTSKPFTMMSVVFRYAFYKNHKKLKETKIDEIFEALSNKNALIEKLAEMLNDTVQALLGEPDEKNAITWEANF